MSPVKKTTVPLAVAVAAALITAVVMSMTFGAISFYAQTRPASSYADDRAAIEDLQARYLFALDFHDPDLYVSTFTPDGVLDDGSGGDHFYSGYMRKRSPSANDK